VLGRKGRCEDPVILPHLGHDHLRGDHSPPMIVQEKVLALLISHFVLDHIRAAGVAPLEISGDFGLGDVGFVKPVVLRTDSVTQ
jgi:hypothetical protein